jgi:hypothetical protein
LWKIFSEIIPILTESKRYTPEEIGKMSVRELFSKFEIFSSYLEKENRRLLGIVASGAQGDPKELKKILK